MAADTKFSSVIFGIENVSFFTDDDENVSWW